MGPKGTMSKVQWEFKEHSKHTCLGVQGLIMEETYAKPKKPELT